MSIIREKFCLLKHLTSRDSVSRWKNVYFVTVSGDLNVESTIGNSLRANNKRLIEQSSENPFYINYQFSILYH